MTSLHKVTRDECPAGGNDEELEDDEEPQMVVEPMPDRTLNGLTLTLLGIIDGLEASIPILSNANDVPRAVEEWMKYGITNPKKGDLTVFNDILAVLQRYLEDVTFLQRQGYEAAMWFDFIADTNEPFRVPNQNLPVLLCDMTDCTFHHDNAGFITLPDGDDAAAVSVSFETEAQAEFIDRVRELAQILADSDEKVIEFIKWSRQLSNGRYDFSFLFPDTWVEVRRTPPTIENLAQAIQQWIRCWYFTGRVGHMLQSLLHMGSITDYLNGNSDKELQERPQTGWPWE
ncbi:hypothetical protein ABW21_db0205174 [Orbilia brochopaga]|nr:hypothetical protein ABW21_db0205174 [Drechslerella brochopaga]